MQLPREPGLRRRLAYGENLRRNTTFIQRNNPLLQFTTIHFDTNNFDTNNFDTNKECGLNVKNLIKNSKIIVYKYNFFCSICQEDSLTCQNEIDYINKISILREFICKHSFHIECIETWLSNNTSCPMCRKSFIDK